VRENGFFFFFRKKKDFIRDGRVVIIKKRKKDWEKIDCLRSTHEEDKEETLRKDLW
jgi:hypothetical protein